MKKTNILKIAMTLVMAFMITGAFAQVADADYSEYDANTAVPTNVDYVTAGATMGYYALPDPIYHPAYVTPAWTLDAAGVWAFTTPGATVDYPVATYPANYAEITFGGAGDYITSIVESYTAAGCDGSTTVMNTTVLPIPTATLTGAIGEAGWGTTAVNTYQRCGVAAGENLTATFAELGVLAANAHYAYGIQQVVTGYNAAGGVVVGPTTTTLVNYNSTLKAVGGADGGTMLTATTGLPLVQFAAADVQTKYEYTLITAADLTAAGVGGTGIASQISQKSDYLAITLAGNLSGTTVYAFTGNTITYTLNLPPVTGPIYYIPNNFYN